MKYRHEREKNEASVDPFLTGKKTEKGGRTEAGSGQGEIRSDEGGYATQVFHISTGPDRRRDASTSQERRPRAVFHNGVGCGKREKRGDRWICGKPAGVRGFRSWIDGVSSNSQRENAVSTIGLAVFGGRDLAAADQCLRNSGLRTGWVVRAGRRLRNGAGDAPRGDCAKKARDGRPARRQHESRRAGGAASGLVGPAAATVAAAVLALRNASIALWLSGPRGAAAAQNRG
ncbi:hypothetical protein KGP76_18995 [Burkholderia cenocepacia]|uniref:hypothetical protein n=1 Tax=Burkholderia cenocepacia TaxID=95486 RepID=UPI00209D4AA0|nr:hypothetical protein [Burkholderia cenocepacia]MCO8367533.1 hypothetical protein [Burkholderia cenocepacia]MCO8447160.1 hypothetical protein [Burkholderia cenocepacia]MCO8516654.1 hypothetical protein [Burkholderia cenocepacia]MCO8535496.1 hypothetical protein [Burkholderia cenocepacia]MCO8597421.1 hypothetical protein [Burkholderia cenocepacia]